MAAQPPVATPPTVVPVQPKVAPQPVFWSPMIFPVGAQTFALGDDELIAQTNQAQVAHIKAKGVLTNTGMKALTDLLEVPACSVTNLCFDTVKADPDAFSALMEAMKTNTSVSTLSIPRSALTTQMLGGLSAMLKVNRGVTRLDLDNSQISSPADFVALLVALKENSTLTHLFLAMVQFGFSGSVALADLLRVNSTILELAMYGCNGTSDGVIALADALKVNKTLQRLSIPTWNAGNKAGIALLAAIHTHPAVEYFDLRRNRFTDEIASNVADALRSNLNLSSIDLESNAFTEDGAATIAEALQINLKTRVNLYGNPIKPQSKSKLKKSVSDFRLSM